MNITISTFEMDTLKQAALKPLEEAAEVFGAWQIVDACGSPEQCKSCNTEGGAHECGGLYELADEIADCVQACAWDSSANTCIGSDSCIGECSYWYRMVKLGIEVGE